MGRRWNWSGPCPTRGLPRFPERTCRAGPSPDGARRSRLSSRLDPAPAARQAARIAPESAVRISRGRTMKAMISTLSLALSLAVAAPALAQTAPTATPAAAPTAADADAFIAGVEKDLFDYSVEASQVNWVNSTYITDDTDAMAARSEEHTSELQSLMRISYAVFCLKKTKNTTNQRPHTTTEHIITS